MQTVGELRKALENCQDETPLSLSTAMVGQHDCGTFGVELDGQNGATIYGA